MYNVRYLILKLSNHVLVFTSMFKPLSLKCNNIFTIKQLQRERSVAQPTEEVRRSRASFEKR